ncbi:MAG: holo-ACP synthase [Methylophilaceae bacterium]
MIFGIGNDVVEIERIKKIYEKFGDHFAKRILNAEEYDIFRSKKNQIQFLAKRFAAKEAFSKALGIGFRHPVTFHGIQVINNLMGQPYLVLDKKINAYLKQQHIIRYHLSISDEKRIASAVVILEK